MKLRECTYPEITVRLRKLAKTYGYAIAVHGSMTRDLDLIAVPWTKEACSAETLISNLNEHIGGSIQQNSPVEKPHGRKSWVIWLDHERYLDISVTSRKDD